MIQLIFCFKSYIIVREAKQSKLEINPARPFTEPDILDNQVTQIRQEKLRGKKSSSIVNMTNTEICIHLSWFDLAFLVLIIKMASDYLNPLKLWVQIS